MHYADAAVIARLVADLPRPVLIGLDVDGVLAPIVDHADDAVLLAGIAEAVSTVAELSGVHVAVVSGRSIADLARFGFGTDVDVIGSHGMETREHAMAPLTANESEVLVALDSAASAAAQRAGDGAWVERKPASVVLHVRQADDRTGRLALDEFLGATAQIEGSSTKAGSGVLEAFARHADKGTALLALGTRLGVVTTVFVGADITDEEAFERLGTADLAIKVGAADTMAHYRLRDPDAVLAWLTDLGSGA